MSKPIEPAEIEPMTYREACLEIMDQTDMPSEGGPRYARSCDGQNSGPLSPRQHYPLASASRVRETLKAYARA